MAWVIVCSLTTLIFLDESRIGRTALSVKGTLEASDEPQLPLGTVAIAFLRAFQHVIICRPFLHDLSRHAVETPPCRLILCQGHIAKRAPNARCLPRRDAQSRSTGVPAQSEARRPARRTAFRDPKTSKSRLHHDLRRTVRSR